VHDGWQLEVRNSWGGVAVPRVFLEDVTDGKGQSTGVVTSPVEVYRLNSLEPIRLFGKARAVYGVLFVDRDRPAGPCLGVCTVNTTKRPDGGDERVRGAVPVNTAAPLDQQGEIRLTFRVVFYSPNKPEEEVTDEVFKFSIIPSTTTGGYDVRPIKLPLAPGR
jgi:hypothetical protein